MTMRFLFLFANSLITQIQSLPAAESANELASIIFLLRLISAEIRNVHFNQSENTFQ